MRALQAKRIARWVVKALSDPALRAVELDTQEIYNDARRLATLAKQLSNVLSQVSSATAGVVSGAEAVTGALYDIDAKPFSGIPPDFTAARALDKATQQLAAAVASLDAAQLAKLTDDIQAKWVRVKPRFAKLRSKP
jgi:hypothetical protein